MLSKKENVINLISICPKMSYLDTGPITYSRLIVLIGTIWNQTVWDNYQKLMMPFHIFVTTHYGGNYFKDKYSLFFAETLWWIAPSEKEGGVILPTGVGIPKPFVLT